MKYKCRRFVGVQRCGKPATELWHYENANWILMVCKQHRIKHHPEADKKKWHKITINEAVVIEIMNS